MSKYQILSHQINQQGTVTYKVINNATQKESLVSPEAINKHSLLLSYWKRVSSKIMATAASKDTVSIIRPKNEEAPLVTDSKKVEIFGIKKHENKLYICIKEENRYNLVEISEAKKQFPSQLATYFESKLTFEEVPKE